MLPPRRYRGYKRGVTIVARFNPFAPSGTTGARAWTVTNAVHRLTKPPARAECVRARVLHIPREKESSTRKGGGDE